MQPARDLTLAFDVRAQPEGGKIERHTSTDVETDISRGVPLHCG
jgi:hypothetical protein